jgi:hypothetical protein
MGVRVRLALPGVHLLPPGAVRVRFRELSFDVTVEHSDGRDYCFAVRAGGIANGAAAQGSHRWLCVAHRVAAQVTELPMEVVVPECSYVVQTDVVKLYLRKWAKTGWHQLQLQR